MFNFDFYARTRVALVCRLPELIRMELAWEAVGELGEHHTGGNPGV